MKIGQPSNPSTPRGSFGIPKDLQDQVGRMKQAQAEKKEGGENTEAPIQSAEEWPLENEGSEAEAKVEASAGEKGNLPNPIAILKGIGIEPTEDDFFNLIFKGFLEKTVDVLKNPINGEAMTAKIRLLTTEEYEIIDELCAEDISTVSLTNSGYEARRSMWTLVFVIQELQGRKISKPVMGEGNKIDVKASARAKKKTIAALNPIVNEKIARIHAQMLTAFSLMLQENKEAILKK